MKTRTLFLFIFLAVLGSCVYKLNDITTSSGERYLIVRAEFSDSPGEQFVTLAYSAPNLKDQVKIIEKATVYISDDTGNRIDFSMDPAIPGRYVTGTTAQAGRTYVLHIQTAEGAKYYSSPEKLSICPPIDTLYHELFDDLQYPKDSRRYKINVLLDFKDSPGLEQYYQWTWTHYETPRACAVCERSIYNDLTQRCEPKEDISQTFQFYCDDACWDIFRSVNYNILSDNYYKGKPVQGVLIAQVPFLTLPFSYYLDVQQRSITKSAYLYFQDLKNQIQSNGTLFDVPAQTQFNFNLFSETNPDEKILGIFNLFSTQKKIIRLDMTQTYGGVKATPTPPLPGTVYLIEVFGQLVPKNIACVPGPNRTNIEPEGWKY
jgi:hypothetical protein